MAEFDGEMLLQDQNAQLAHENLQLRNSFETQNQEITYLRNMVQQPPRSPPPPSKSLNLPLPPRFSGSSSDLNSFKLRLIQYLGSNMDAYADSHNQILFTGSLMDGPASQWYESLIDPSTYHVPSTYTFDTFIQELDDFFGGGVTLHSRERSLIGLRQTGSVSELAISFQNITNHFRPRWPDHPLIFVFSQKLKEVIRFELTARGDLPSKFQAYIAAAISIEHNQAAAAQSRSHPHPPPRLPFIPKAILPSPPRLPGPHHPPPTPMDVDGTRNANGNLTPEERRRRYDGGLSAYCGQHGHVISTCPRKFQVRGVVPVPSQPPPTSSNPPPGYPSPLPGYYPPPGYQLVPQTFPTPWTQVPPPHTSFYTPPALPGPLPKNGPPSQ